MVLGSLITKVFAYTGTTTREDQCVAKVLAGYPEPYLPVSTPSSRDLKLQTSAGEYRLVVALRDELYKNVFNYESPSLNVDTAVVEATFGAVLIHLEEMQTIESAGIKSGSPFTSHYLYHFERGIHTVNRKLGTELTMHQCCEWGSKLKASWQATNFMQVGKDMQAPSKSLRRRLRSSWLRFIVYQS